MDFKNKVVLVTGASKGIGKATALLFGKLGASVVVNYNSDEKNAKEVAELIKKSGGKAICIKADVSKQNEVKEMFKQTLKTYATIDILVNNAGFANKSKTILDATSEEWDATFATNLKGVFLCCQEAAKIMLEKNTGTIVNISSIRGLEHCGRPGILDYCAAKAGVINLTKSLAKELAPNIRVNSVAPGFTETDNAKKWPEDVKKKAVNDAYIKRLVQPEEIANAVAFLASNEASAITGQVLIVDCGYSLK